MNTLYWLAAPPSGQITAYILDKIGRHVAPLSGPSLYISLLCVMGITSHARAIRIHSLAIGFGQTTDGTMFCEETVFQIDGRLTNDVIRTDQVIIHDGHSEIFVYWDFRGELKHPRQGK